LELVLRPQKIRHGAPHNGQCRGPLDGAVTALHGEDVRVHSGGSTAIGRNVGYRIAKFAELLSGSWLDFGCAVGGYAPELLRAGAKRVTGVDVSRDPF
jgi:2-polyprenyl-3-methyl-5-hydroxy-6-metoxy-1,4-benzoquinol methylase